MRFTTPYLPCHQLPFVCAALSIFASSCGAQAKIDESKTVQTFYVSPSGQDSNTGTDAKTPFASIQKAIDNSGSKPTKIVLADGTYRRYVEVKPGDNLLIFEAQNAGKAIISGADSVAGWKETEVKSVFSREWTQKWGLNTENAWWGSTPFNRRREMVYLNDDRLLQRVGEQGAPVAATALEPGEFTVDENNSQILLRVPRGVDINTANVEVSMRGHDTGFYPQTQAWSRPLFKIEQHSNIVLRGLVIKRAANAMKFGAALHIEGDQTKRSAAELPENVLIDRCTIVENNAIGMEINNYRAVTVKDSRFNDNGERGAGMIQVGAERNVDPKTLQIARRGYLWQNCQFNDNNWRMAGTWGEMNDSAGFKAFGQSGNGELFLRCQFNRNLANGYWQDYSGENTVLDSCLIEDNMALTAAGGYGILNEMTRGPLTVKGCVIRRNSNVGFISSGSPNVTLENNFIYYNNFDPKKNDNYWAQEVRINSDTGRDSADFPFTLKGWKIIENTFASLGGDVNGKLVIGQIFQIGGANFPDVTTPAAQFAKYVVSENNTFSKNPTDHENGTGMKILYSLDAGADNKPNITFEQWQAQTNANGKQDQKSKFVYPLDLSQVKDPTIKPTK